MATSEARLPAGGAQAPEASAGDARVLHSEHYNSALQRALIEVEKIDADGLMQTAAAEAAYQYLVEHPAWSGKVGAQERVRRVVDLFRYAGLGELELGGVSEEGGEALLGSSHFARGWHARYGRAERPVCAAAGGVLIGALAALHDRRYQVKETHCVARGAAQCRFKVTPVDGPVELYPEILYPVPPSLVTPEFLPSPIDEEAIVRALFGDEHPAEAAAPMLGAVSLTRLWADYYNRVSFRFEQQVPQVLGSKFSNLASIVLTEAGHVCAFHTFGGLLVSDAWQERVRPLLRSREEWAHALLAVINTLGWGTWRIESLVPGQRLTVRVYDSYEAMGFRRHFGLARAPRCFLGRGVSAAVMNLLYVGDITTRPALTPSYYNDLFRSPLSYRALETRCRAMEEDYCEFVVNPLSPTLGKIFGR